jgi:hypothetical protein
LVRFRSIDRTWRQENFKLSTGAQQLSQATEGEPARPLPRLFWRRLAFFAGVPLIVAIYAAANNWSIIEAVGYPGAILFYLAHAFIPWWTTCLVTQGCWWALRSWQPPQLILLTVGTLLACVIILPYSNWVTGTLESYYQASHAEASPFAEAHLGFVSYAVRASLVWIVINLVFDRWVGLPRYRYSRPVTEAAVDINSDPGPMQAGGTDVQTEMAASPRFLARLPDNLSAKDLVMLKAEQHYIQAYFPKRRVMTLYRFSDALQELDSSLGMQVHRSYWVNKSAIQSVRKRGRQMSLEMLDGSSVPVSGPYQALVRQAAADLDLPVKPGGA